MLARRDAAGVAIAVLAGWACFGPTEPPDDPPEITGIIVEISSSPDPGRIRIAEDPRDPQTRSAYFGTDHAAILIRTRAGDWIRGEREDLQVGATASGWYERDGLIRDSGARQGQASHIAVF